MTYLVDANILSEPTRARPHVPVLDWLRHNERQIVVDPVILGEIRFGIYLVPPGRRRKQLELWFEKGVRKIRCLPWDLHTSMRWAKLLADLRAAGKAMPIKDSLIAATALLHHLTVATRNERDFKNAGVKIVNPFDGK